MTVQVDGEMPEFDWPAAIGAWSKKAAPLGLAVLRARAPFRTGAFRQSVDDETLVAAGTATVSFFSALSYAPYIVDGTGPHPIAARNARALRWLGPGGMGVNFAARVQHPGTKANLFPEEAGAAAGMSVFGMFADAIKEEMGIE
jgi:hypothetical protein